MSMGRTQRLQVSGMARSGHGGLRWTVEPGLWGSACIIGSDAAMRPMLKPHRIDALEA